jgi:ornithine cyclodeaminase
LISVFHENFARGIQSHQGLVILFDPETGAPVCAVHAGEITAIRTAAASAVATDALARKDARRLALLGYGEQAETHARAIQKIRTLESIVVWGRSRDRAHTFAERIQAELAVPVAAAGVVREAVAEADIICTVTSAPEPILKGEWVRPGTHLNLVGSSYAGPAEVDSDLVIRSRFIADSREGVLNQGAEFLRAKARANRPLGIRLRVNLDRDSDGPSEPMPNGCPRRGRRDHWLDGCLYGYAELVPAQNEV